MQRTWGLAAIVIALLVAIGATAWWVGAVELPGEDAHKRAAVTVADPDGTHLATVEARVADTRAERIRGLSEAESLADGSGMLFVHPRTGSHAYVMRDMAFPLDIVFVEPCGDCPAGVDGRVTVVHGAAVPPPGGPSAVYEGRAKWVLEVPRGFAESRGIDAGDHVTVRYGA